MSLCLKEREQGRKEREGDEMERGRLQAGRVGKSKRGTVFVRFDIINRLQVNPATSIENFLH
jgi:hypothetical protein